MKLRNPIRAAVLLTLTAAVVQACPNSGADHSRTAMVLTPPASHASVVAWKPRAWSPTTTANGYVVSIDPVDGAMGMPAAGELGSFARIGLDAPVPTYVRANGSVRATLDDRFADFAVVKMGADGKPMWTCVHGTTGAAQFMKNPVVKSTPVPVQTVKWEVK